MQKPARLIVIISACLTGFVFLANAAANDLISGWALVAPVPQPIIYQRVVTYDNRILMIGGEVPIWTTPEAPLLQAKVETDGSILQWTTPIITGTTSLPNPLHRHALVQVPGCSADVLYVIGGFSNGNRYARVWHADWDHTSQQLTGWVEIRNYPRKIVLHEALYANNRIYVLGGLNEADQPLDEVYSAEVYTNGDLAPWVKEKELPKPLYRFASTSYLLGGRQSIIYVIGGYNGVQVQRAIYGAAVDDKNQLSEWKEIGLLPRPLAYHRVVIINQHLIVIGGTGDDGSYNEVYSTLLDADGRLGEWRTEANLPDSISRFAAIPVTYPNLPGSILYVIGGTNGDNFRAQVYHSSLLPPLLPTNVPSSYVNYLPIVSRC